MRNADVCYTDYSDRVISQLHLSGDAPVRQLQQSTWRDESRHPAIPQDTVVSSSIETFVGTPILINDIIKTIIVFGVYRTWLQLYYLLIDFSFAHLLVDFSSWIFQNSKCLNNFCEARKDVLLLSVSM
jgi:hypothetical protein